MRPRLEKVFAHEPEFDSMPDRPGMGYLYESWGIHSPGFDHSLWIEKTRGKVHESSDPRMRPKYPNFKVSLSSYPLGINWEFNLHPRKLSAEFGYAWINTKNGQRQRTHASPWKPPDELSLWMDLRRKRERDHIKKYSWERVDPPSDTGPYYDSYGDSEGITSSVPGVYFKAWQPNNSRAHYLVLEARAESDDTILRQYKLPLLYEPRFGIDQGDAYAFDILTGTVENEMLNETWKHAKPPCPVCHEPLWTTHTHEDVEVSAIESAIEDIGRLGPVPRAEYDRVQGLLAALDKDHDRLLAELQRLRNPSEDTT